MAVSIQAGVQPHTIIIGSVAGIDPGLRIEIEQVTGSIRQTTSPDSLTMADWEHADCLVILNEAALTPDAMRQLLVSWSPHQEWSGLFIKSGKTWPIKLWNQITEILLSQPRGALPSRRLGLAEAQPIRTRLRAGPFALDSGNHIVTIAGEEIVLRPMEYLLLSHFLEYPNRLHHRQELVDVLWGDGTAIDPRTVDVHVARLRKALSEKGQAGAIETVFRFGYRFRPDRSAQPRKLSHT